MDLCIVGKHVERIDAKAKATGDARFTVDTRLPGTVHARFLRSPYAHARIDSIDISEAEALSGVLSVVTHSELMGMRLHNDCFDDRVRYLGEAVAGVAMLNEEIAERALDAIKIVYTPLAELLDAKDALAKDATAIWGEGNVCTWGGPRSIRGGNSLSWEKGDTKKAFEAADAVVECEMDTHAQFHGCLEPHACLASWNGGLDTLTMYISGQGIFEDQENIAHALGLPLDKVQVKCPFVGGGFGAKAHNTCKEYLMTALLTKKCRRSVLYIPSRSEEIITAMRHPASFSCRIGANNDGAIQAISMTALRSGGAHTSLQMNFLLGSTEYVAPTYLRSPNVKYEGLSAYTTLPLCAAFRGFGYFEGGTAFAQAVDMVAEKLQMDPLEFLLKNVPRKGDPVSTDQGPLTTEGIAETVEACAKAICWKEKWHTPNTKRLPDGRMHGIAVAHAMGRATLPNFVTSGNATVQIKKDGSARVFAGISDMGQGQATGIAQIAAETLGIPFDAITVTWGDTVAPHTGDQVASSTTMMTGNAVKLAAEDAKKQILQYAESVIETDRNKLAIRDGFVYETENPNNRIAVEKIIRLPGVKIITGNGKWSVTDAEASPRSVVVCIAEVAVDTETGKVDVINMIQGADCGRVISKSRVEGQMDAVLSGGMGYMLMEDWSMDKGDHGRILNLNLYDYKMPTFLDTHGILEPNIILEYPDEVGPFGARGMGEATLSASAPALLNAVYNAIGVRFHSTPLTPDKILGALYENRRSQKS
jgi:xanthine dehydrogenase molybdenum-binding subunit